MKVNRNALEYVFQTGGEFSGETVFNTTSLEPNIVWATDKQLSSESEMSDAILHNLSQKLMESIGKTLDKHRNQKIGYLLSGGVDSSLLLYLLKKVAPDLDIIAYHTDWHYEERSETKYAKQAAGFAGVPLKVIDTSPEAQIPFIDEALRKSKSISYSAIPVFMSFNEMMKDGVHIAVNALGLDELFAGYTIHRKYYTRSSLHFVPYVQGAQQFRYYRAASKRWGRDKAWFLTNAFPSHHLQYVKGSQIDFTNVYEKRLKANNLWNSIHNLILDAMVSHFANLISRGAQANGLEVIYPYMENDLMDYCLGLSPALKYNKAPIRQLMRKMYGFHETLAHRGEQWDKIGWGGTALPYFQSEKFMKAILPENESAETWFTELGCGYYNSLETNPTVIGLHMAIFLKTLELTRE